MRQLIKRIFAVGAMSLALARQATATTQQQQQQEQQQPEDEQAARKNWVFNDCGAITALEEDGITLIGGGLVTFTGIIDCEAVALLEFRGDTVINSSAGGIHTKNVMFLTAPDTQVVFSAPTVILERDEAFRGPTEPLLWGVGVFEFDVTEEFPTNPAGASVDESGLTDNLGDQVRSQQQIVYAKDTILAFRPKAIEVSKPEDAPGSMFPTDTFLLEKLAKKQARVFGRAGPTTTTTAGGGNDLQSEASSADQPPYAHDKNAWISLKRQGFKASSQFGPSGARPSANPSPADEKKQQSFRNPWTRKGGRSTGAGPSSANGTNGTNGKKQPFGGMNPGAWREDIVPPAEIQPHPKPFVEVGDLMTGTLRMKTSNRVGINVSGVDGSVRLVKPVRLPARDKDGKLVGPEPRSYWTLLRSDTAKVTEVLRRRYEIQVEDDRGNAKEGEKEEGANKGVEMARLSRKERKLRELAKAHLGEVVLTISNRGVVEVTMDGSTVLKKGGPSFFGYRRKGPYRLLATRNGFKVERRGNVRWTVTANDKEDYVVP